MEIAIAASVTTRFSLNSCERKTFKMAVRPGTVQPSVSVKDQLPNIKKLIMEAQTLDDNGDEMVRRPT